MQLLKQRLVAGGCDSCGPQTYSLLTLPVCPCPLESYTYYRTGGTWGDESPLIDHWTKIVYGCVVVITECRSEAGASDIARNWDLICLSDLWLCLQVGAAM